MSSCTMAEQEEVNCTSSAAGGGGGGQDEEPSSDCPTLHPPQHSPSTLSDTTIESAIAKDNQSNQNLVSSSSGSEADELSSSESKTQAETKACVEPVDSCEQIKAESHPNADIADTLDAEQNKTKVTNDTSTKQKDDIEVEKSSSCDAKESKNETTKHDGEKGSPPQAGSSTGEDLDYELVDGYYYYTDSHTGHRYRYDGGEWVLADTDTESEQQVKTDSEGRTYYYADNMYLCRDSSGNVFFLNEKNEWQAWGEKGAAADQGREQQEGSNWYFYQGDSKFYRNTASGVVYKFNEESNEWEVFEGKLKKKRAITDEEEEFDTEDEEEEDDEVGLGLAPPGATTDPNIKKEGNTYTRVDPTDNMKYEWDTHRRAWFPKVDEHFMATYQMSYGFNPDGTVNENPVKYDDDEEEEDEDEQAKLAEEKQKEQAKAKAAKKKATWFEMDEAHNTKVYVSNLPDDMTEPQFLALMQKCGMIMLDPNSNKPRVKLYYDKEGNFKGDALCTYIKIESVDLALQILDEYQVGNKKIHVERAKFQQKGEYNPKLKPRKKQKKELAKLQKRQEKLFDWRPEPMRGQRKKSDNTVIIRNVFDPKEFQHSMEKILDYKEAMRNHCSNFGRVKKLELHDLHPDGVVQVVFEDVESADMCVATLNNRLYNTRTLSVTTWDGREKFKIEETEEARKERIEKWNKFLAPSQEAKT